MMLEQEIEKYLSGQTLCNCDSVSYRNIKNLILGFAEPREKRIAELEAEVKEWKDKADLWCKTANLKDHNIMINKELEKENAELKKKCYKKAVKDYCELEKENAELKEMIQEMYFLLRNYDKFFLGDRLLKCFEKVENYNFLKDSEVEK